MRTLTPDLGQCTKMVCGDYHRHQCTRKAVVVDPDGPRCRQHSADAEKAKEERRAEESRLRRESWAEEDRKRERVRICVAFCEGVPNEALPPGGLLKLLNGGGK